MNSFDFMRGGTPMVSQIEYPLIQESAKRIQIIFEEQLYGMLILNESTGKWCGYTLVSQAEAENYILDSWREYFGISYVAPANDPIVWMGPDRWGGMNVPMNLLPSEGGDFWVGFHSDYTGPVDEQTMAVAKLTTFVNRLNQGLKLRANPPV